MAHAPHNNPPSRRWRGLLLSTSASACLALGIPCAAPAASAAPAPVAVSTNALGGPAAAALSADARAMLKWLKASRDNAGSPFIVIDKRAARLWIFDAQAQLKGSTPILLGLARGDRSVPGIGERPLNQVLPHERTTPAGRFIAEPGRNTAGEDIFWVDYDAAVSMHRVRATKASERRLERLATTTAGDNRISYGCINVPAAFYDGVIRPEFEGRRGVIYVIPETLPMTALFVPPAAARQATASAH